MQDDFRFAFRQLVRAPAFTAVALTVLALGIGAGTVVFSVVDAVVLRGLPFERQERLAAVFEWDAAEGAPYSAGSTTPQNYLDWRAQQGAFEGLAASTNTRFLLRNELDEPIDTLGQRITWELLPALRSAPIIGRNFTANDEVAGRNRVTIIGHDFWQRQFGGARDVVGRTIALNDLTYEIVGVLPRGFNYPLGFRRTTDIFVPLTFGDFDRVRGQGRNIQYRVFGRLKDGVSMAQAADDMARIGAAINAQHPTWSDGRSVRTASLHEQVVGRVRPWMLMLLGAVSLVLVIACMNVANLMLARATVRHREMGIRSALGASRWRLVRGLLVEGLVLSLLGAALGTLLAGAAMDVIRAWLPAGLPRSASVAIDLRVLGATIGAALLTGTVFGMAPALSASRPDLTRALKDGGRSVAGGGQRLRNTLVIAEVALAVVLLVGAGLFLGSFLSVIRISPGFDYHQVLSMDVGVRVQPGGLPAARRQGVPYVEQMLEAVRGVDGVQAAGAVEGGLPLTGSYRTTPVTLPGRGALTSDDDQISTSVISPAYLEALRIPLLRGRGLDDRDRAGAPAVILVNQFAAEKYWPGEDAIGQRIVLDMGEKTERTVVGVVGNIRQLGPETPPRPEGYMPLAQGAVLGATLVMRTHGDPLAVLPRVKAAIWAVNKEQRLTGEIVTLEGHMDRLLSQRRFNMALLVSFGVLGLVIAAVGIYGVMTYIVAQRTSEIGIRMALGATQVNVMGMVLQRAAMLIGTGLAIGSAGAWFLTTLVAAFLYSIQPTDLRVFAAAIGVLAAAGLVASTIPARRAASVDPLVALRQD